MHALRREEQAARDKKWTLVSQHIAVCYIVLCCSLLSCEILFVVRCCCRCCADLFCAVRLSLLCFSVQLLLPLQHYVHAVVVLSSSGLCCAAVIALSFSVCWAAVVVLPSLLCCAVLFWAVPFSSLLCCEVVVLRCLCFHSYRSHGLTVRVVLCVFVFVFVCVCVCVCVCVRVCV
jgi:hypothetical protein